VFQGGLSCHHEGDRKSSGGGLEVTERHMAS